MWKGKVGLFVPAQLSGLENKFKSHYSPGHDFPPQLFGFFPATEDKEITSSNLM